MQIEEQLQIIAIIPARGGSKRLPQKNILPLVGKPLIAYSIEQAKASSLIKCVIVSTDDRKIETVAKEYGAEVVKRPSELSGDMATSELALLHVLDHLFEVEHFSPDLVVFLQCTSPLRDGSDIENAIRTLRENNADSLFSACRFNKCIWEIRNGALFPINYDYKNRWREQDFPLQFKENGSIYVFKPWVLRELNNRLGGIIALYEMDFLHSFQIDSTEDLELCEFVIKNQLNKKRKENAK
jgi:N-acylneuraminate cytidylyltransferase